MQIFHCRKTYSLLQAHHDWDLRYSCTFLSSSSFGILCNFCRYISNSITLFTIGIREVMALGVAALRRHLKTP